MELKRDAVQTRFQNQIETRVEDGTESETSFPISDNDYLNKNINLNVVSPSLASN